MSFDVCVLLGMTISVLNYGHIKIWSSLLFLKKGYHLSDSHGCISTGYLLYQESGGYLLSQESGGVKCELPWPYLVLPGVL